MYGLSTSSNMTLTKKNYEIKLKKVQLESYDNSWYKPGSKLKRFLWLVINALVLKSSIITSSKLKVFFLRLFGAKVGRNTIIKPSVNIKYPWFLSIGDNVWIGENVWLDNLAPIDIGDNVCISQGVTFITGNHNYKKTSFDLMLGPIKLKEGVWIGANCTVYSGITAHSHAVLAASSMTSKDLEAYTIYQGNPALPVKKRIIE